MLDDWGFLASGRRRARRPPAVLRARPAPGKTLAAEVVAGGARASTCSSSTCRAWSRNGSARPRRTSPRVFDAAERRAGGAVLRRGRRPVRQAHRGRRRARPLRQPRDRLPAAAPRALRRAWRSSPPTSARTSTPPSPAGSSSSSTSTRRTAASGERLWRRHLPADGARSPPTSTSTGLAALYRLSGGLIRNAAVAAAFLAAAEAEVTGEACISLRHLVRAVRREYAKAGQSFPGAPQGVPA